MRMMMTSMKMYILAACFLLAAAGFSFAQQQEYHYFEIEGDEGNTRQGSAYDSSQQTQTEYRFQQKGAGGNRQYRFQQGTFPDYLIEVNANSDTFEGRFAGAFSFLPEGFSLGLNGIGSDKDYYSGSIDAMFGTGFSGSPFSFDIGIRGIGGTAEFNDNADSTLSAVGFAMKARYDIREFRFFSLFIDMDIGGELAGSPGPLCFSETEGYLDTRLYLDINLMPNKRSAVTLGYRYLRMEFEENKVEWTQKDDGAYFGFKFRF